MLVLPTARPRMLWRHRRRLYLLRRYRRCRAVKLWWTFDGGERSVRLNAWVRRHWNGSRHLALYTALVTCRRSRFLLSPLYRLLLLLDLDRRLRVRLNPYGAVYSLRCWALRTGVGWLLKRRLRRRHGSGFVLPRTRQKLSLLVVRPRHFSAVNLPEILLLASIWHRFLFARVELRLGRRFLLRRIHRRRLFLGARPPIDHPTEQSSLGAVGKGDETLSH